MDNKNSGNGPFDFFGLGPADGVSFEPSKPKEQSKPKSFDLGPINAPSATNTPPAPAKKKFEVHFDDSDMIAPVEPVTSSQTSGIYFTPRKKKPEETAQKKTVQKKPQKKGSGFGKNFKNLSSNKALIAFCSAVVLCAVIVSCVAISCINDVFALNRSEESVSITIPNNADADQIIDILSDNGLVKQKLFCKFFYNLTQAIFNDEDDEPPVFLSGVYYVAREVGKVMIEQNYGIFEGLDRKNPDFLANKRQFATRYPGGESMLDMAGRIYPLLREIKEKYPDKTVLLACHGGVCRVIRSFFLPMTNEEFASYSPENCSLECYKL